MQRPSKNVITLRYGATTDPYAPGNPHIGVDFSSLPDDKIYMPEDGVVQLVPDDGTCGRSIHIMVGNRHHALCHTSKYLVKDNEFVNQGKPIAIMGDTGYAFGKHLHWALKIGGKFVDPIKQATNKKEKEVITRGRAIRLLRLARRGTDEKRIKDLMGQDEDKWLDSVYKASWFKDQTAKINNGVQALKEKIINLVKGA